MVGILKILGLNLISYGIGIVRIDGLWRHCGRHNNQPMEEEVNSRLPGNEMRRKRDRDDIMLEVRKNWTQKSIDKEVVAWLRVVSAPLVFG